MEFEANRRVETSVRTFAIVEQLSRVEKAGVSALASELDMSKGIAHNHLNTLRELGYVTKIDGEYRLSPKLLSVGFSAQSNTPLCRFGTNLIGPFAEKFDVSVIVCQRAGDCCIVVDTYRVSSVNASLGTAFPLYESLTGLAIVALTPVLDKQNVAGYDMASIEDNIDKQGYAAGELSSEVPVNCLAAPVNDESGVCRGSTGVLLPEDYDQQRLQRLTEATVSLRTRLESRFDSGRTEEWSFATEKHSWIG